MQVTVKQIIPNYKFLFNSFTFENTEFCEKKEQQEIKYMN